LGMKIFPNAAIYANLGKTSDQARDANDSTEANLKGLENESAPPP